MIRRKCDKCKKYSYSSVEERAWTCPYCGEILCPDKNEKIKNDTLSSDKPVPFPNNKPLQQ